MTTTQPTATTTEVTEAMAERFSAGVSKYWQGRRSGRDGDAIMAGLEAALSTAPSGDGVPGMVLDGAIADIVVERRRQVEDEGWTPEHDDQHKSGELAIAAACYALNSADDADGPEIRFVGADLWPWSDEWWKPTDPRRDLVKAGALIAAEIERLDRSQFRPVRILEKRGPALGYESDVAFLREAARFFERADPMGEDRAFWANISNARRCNKIASRLLTASSWETKP